MSDMSGCNQYHMCGWTLFSVQNHVFSSSLVTFFFTQLKSQKWRLNDALCRLRETGNEHQVDLVERKFVKHGFIVFFYARLISKIFCIQDCEWLWIERLRLLFNFSQITSIGILQIVLWITWKLSFCAGRRCLVDFVLNFGNNVINQHLPKQQWFHIACQIIQEQPIGEVKFPGDHQHVPLLDSSRAHQREHKTVKLVWSVN